MYNSKKYFEHHLVLSEFLNISFESYIVNEIKNHTIGYVTYYHKPEVCKINATSLLNSELRMEWFPILPNSRKRLLSYL